MNPDYDPDIFKKYYEEYDKYQQNIFKKENMYNMDYIQKIEKELRQKTYTQNQLEELDVSNSLSDDARAKLQLLHGDFIIIPVDKL